MDEMDKKEFKRLPKTVIPVNYDIILEPNFEDFTFNGKQSISVTINETVSEVTINSAEIEIRNVTWTEKSTGVIQAAVGLPIYDEDLETVTFTFEPPLKLGSSGCIGMEFKGSLNDEERGFFRSKFQAEKKKEKWIAVTQFEPTHARRCFPCWDEPTFKATFDIELIVEKGKQALSNMDLKSCKHDFGNGDGPVKTHFQFETTPIMSSYLVAFSIGDFKYIETRNGDVRYRVYRHFCKKKKGEFALEVASRAIPFFTEFFNLPCGLKKVDLIALPEFCKAGMENWGLLVFDETKLLDDDKKSIALIVAHELCHFWFGNLVSMEWWSHLWLKEGFAVYFEYFCVDKLYPKFNIWSRFDERSFNKAINMDSWNEGHPLEAPVGYPSEIEAIFDEITYEKGASIIRMLYQYIGGDEYFRNGVNLFLKRHQYKTAVPKDLWTALEDASGKPVAGIMETWIKEEGFPEVRITKHKIQKGKGRVVYLTQQKYNQSHCRHKWKIPLTFSSSSNPDKVIYSVLMTNRTMEVVIPDVTQSEWIELNHKSVGFYMVHCPTTLIGIYNNDRPIPTDVPLSSMDENEDASLISEVHIECIELDGDEDDVVPVIAPVNPQIQTDLENDSMEVDVAGTGIISSLDINDDDDDEGPQRKRPREEEPTSLVIGARISLADRVKEIHEDKVEICCDGCSKQLKNTQIFICTECLDVDEDGGYGFDLCSSCYRSKRKLHRHSKFKKVTHSDRSSLEKNESLVSEVEAEEGMEIDGVEDGNVAGTGTIPPLDINDDEGRKRPREVAEESGDGDITPPLAESGSQTKKSCVFEKATTSSADSQEKGNNVNLRRGITFDVLPPVNNFTGRKKELEELHKMLLKNETDQTIWICGGKGVGKTELVRRYVSVKGQDFDSNCIWINVETEDSLMESFKRFKSAHLRPKRDVAEDEAENDSEDKALKSIIEEFTSLNVNAVSFRKGKLILIINYICTFFDNSKNLFVFDIANDTREIFDWLACAHSLLLNFRPDDQNPNFRFIVISREKRWVSVGTAINLKPLSFYEIFAAACKAKNQSMEGSVHNSRQETQSSLNASGAGVGSSTSVEEPHQSGAKPAKLKKESKEDSQSTNTENEYLMDLADIKEEFWKPENRAAKVSLCLVLEHVSQQRCYFNADKFCIKHFLQFWEQDRFQLRTKPFRHYTLRRWNFDDKNVTENVMPLWGKFGRTIQRLDLNFCSTEEVISENFYQIVFNSTPNLLTLRISENEFKQLQQEQQLQNDKTSGKKEENVKKRFQIKAMKLAETLTPNFQLIQILLAKNSLLPFCFDIFFAKLFPNIEEVLEVSRSNSFCVPNLLPKKDTAGISPIKRLFLVGSEIGGNWRNLFLALQQTSLLLLERILIKGPHDNGKDEWIDEFNEFLKSHATFSLKELIFEVAGTDKRSTNNLFCLGDKKMISLESLQIIVSPLENLNFIAAMPSLKLLRVGMENDCSLDHFRQSNMIIRLDNIPCSTKLFRLQKVYVDYNFLVEDLKLFGKCAPSIVEFICKADNSAFRVICSLWKLVRLELLPGSIVDDRGITGKLNRKPSSKPVEPNITTLTSSLKVFKITDWSGVLLLTDVSLLEGFLLLENLQKLTIEAPFQENQISPTAKKLLLDKLPVPHIIDTDTFCIRPEEDDEHITFLTTTDD